MGMEGIPDSFYQIGGVFRDDDGDQIFFAILFCKKAQSAKVAENEISL